MNSSITRRWVRGSLLITILVLVAAETVFLYFTVTMNYDSVRRALESRVSTIITQLSVGDTQTEEGRGVLLRRMLEQFSEKDKFELMLVNSAGAWPSPQRRGPCPDGDPGGSCRRAAE